MATKTIPKNNDGGWYYPAGRPHGIKAGDIIEMTGDYSYVNLDAVIGTKEQPVIFKAKGVVRCGTNGDYGFIITNSKYFRVESDTTNHFIFGGADVKKPIAQTFNFTGSDNLEVFGAELCNGEVGFHSNKKGDVDQRYENIYLHNNWVHNLSNPDEGGRAEGFYIGNTDKAWYQKGPHLHNVRIENNLVEDVTGDGIQMAKSTNLVIKNNIIRRYGTANLENQRTGIIVGGCSTGEVTNNTIQDGKGGAIQVFGAGEVVIKGNVMERTSTNPTDDGIYIDGKCSDGPALTVRLTNNTIDHASRDLVRDVKGNAIVQNEGNSWNGSTPPPQPSGPKYLFTLDVFDDGTTKKVTKK